MAMFKRAQFTTECIPSVIPLDKEKSIRFSESNKDGLNGARLAYRLFNGPIPQGHVVRHVCGRPECINPTHLFTERRAAVCAEAGSASKLTPQQYWYIRRSPVRGQILADQFEVTPQHISLLRRVTNDEKEKWSLHYALVVLAERLAAAVRKGGHHG